MDQVTSDDKVRRARRRAGRIERIERGWPALLPGLAALAAYAVLAELALPQKLPLPLHLIIVLALAAFVCVHFWRALWRTRTAAADVLDRRIERRSGLHHQPLQALTDHPVGGAQSIRDAVWQAHRARSMRQLDRLRAGAPRLGLWRYAAGRATVLLLPLLAVSWIAAGIAAGPRLASGFLPGLFDLPGPAPWMQAWITPAAYARTAPVFLTDRRGAFDVPFGSVLQISVTGLVGVPRLSERRLGTLHATPGPRPQFERLATGSWRLIQTLDRSTTISLAGNGRRLADWTIRVAPLPPSLVAWNGKPGPASEPWRTRLPWRIGDPYGMDRLVAVICLTDARHLPDTQGVPPLTVRIPLEPGTNAAHGTALPELSADPRAGEAVIATLIGTDSKGRHIRGADARFTLPARPFHSPLARAVLDTRKRLALGRESRGAAALDLEALGGAPGQFASDSGLFLNLVSVASLLRDDAVGGPDATSEATARLWQLALGLEDGLHDDRNGALAEADLRAARGAVAAQLEHMRELGDKGQSEQQRTELERRMQALSQAIARRMQALAEQAERQHTVLPPLPDARMLSGQDLARMMRQMQAAAARGDTKEAMRRLGQMQAMLDRMRAATPRDLQAAEREAQAASEAHEQMQDLRDLVKRETGLLDQTQARRAATEKQDRARSPSTIDPQTAELLRRLGIPPGELDATPPPAAPEGVQVPEGQQAAAAGQQRAAQRRQGAQVQHGLARALDELAQEFRELSGGRSPDGLTKAHADMDRARKALATGDDVGAESAQEQALAALQHGTRQMQQMMASAAAGSPMFMPGMADGSGGGSPDDQAAQEQAGDDERSGPRDPLGRPVANGPQADDGDTHVPDKFEQMRARVIEQEIRRRDTDRTRPPAELNYLDRLLKPF